LSVEIKELQELIAQERAAEEKVRKAKEEAQEIVKQTREKAESMSETIDSDTYQQQLRQTKKDETERKKAEITEEYRRKISELNGMAKENFEKAVSFVTKKLVSVEI
jgi:V/A-type H+-transporting ATPase subunit G/H